LLCALGPADRFAQTFELKVTKQSVAERFPAAAKES